MSVIENPVADLNETNNRSCEEESPSTESTGKEPAPAIILAVPPPTVILDETPLSSTSKEMSPKRLSDDETNQTSDGAPQNSADENHQNEEKEEEKNGKSETADVPLKATDTNADTPSAPSTSTNLLDLASKMESDESDDEEYTPGLENEDEGGEAEERQVEEVQRQYSLRGGVKGTATEEVKEVTHDDAEKKRADDIWKAFKADVAKPLKRNAEKSMTATKETTYDFAGEAVTVREEIKSKRRSFVSTLGLDRKRRRESAPCPSRATSTESDLSTPSESAVSDPSEVTKTADLTTDRDAARQGGVKRPRPVSKLGSIVNRLTKRPKMTVLDKTALDWEKFKDVNSIKEDVKNEAKSEGYLEKQDFLSRADERQFELEKEIRLQQQRRRNMMNSKQY